jgi:uncharacterized protein YjbJ (UPF0337 family)
MADGAVDRSPTVNWDRVQGGWRLFKGATRVHWGVFRRRDDLVSKGRREILAAKLQVAYGIGKDAATGARTAPVQRDLIQELGSS